jgi:predicted O-methyltransferase YrrM
MEILFKEIIHPAYNNLKIYEKIGEFEREFGLVSELSKKIFVYSQKYYTFFDELSKKRKVHLSSQISEDTVCYIESNPSLDIINLIIDYKPILLSPNCVELSKNYHFSIPLKNSDKNLYYQIDQKYLIDQELKYYIKDGVLDYDNLINYCMIVKNAGDIFEKILTENLPIIDKWTILDTGSTDNTVEIINRVLVGKKKGKLYQEPFINFRDSRNRCLELCGYDCAYNLMLDDTYVIRGDLRGFFHEIRGDQFADSFSLIIISDDLEYYSNRITKSEKDLRYKYIIHEVIQKENNVNVVIPKEKSFIYDYRTDYMEKRTMERKKYDLDCLFQMVREDPNDSRNYYYIAQTYSILGNIEKAAEYFHKRAFFNDTGGFDQEKYDALFELARIYNFKLNKPWEEIEKLYLLYCQFDPERPDALYFLGIHYYLEKEYSKAYQYFKKGFEVGFPYHRQYSLKPTLSYYYLPRYLTEVCYYQKDYLLGEKAALFFFEHNSKKDDFYDQIMEFYKIYQKCNLLVEINNNPIESEQTIFAFLIDGNWNSWSGKDILNKGLGGSETWAVETAKWISKLTNFEVVVFCNTKNIEDFEGVKYIPINQYFFHIANVKIKHLFISRYSEYIQASIEGHVENIYLIAHDLTFSGNIIPIHSKIQKIYCLTNWHMNYLGEIFPEYKDKIDVYNYGIDFELFDGLNCPKIKNSFIYSSFPNRGLVVILRMWDNILKHFPDATLNLFVDLEHSWTLENFREEIEEIKGWIEKYSQSIKNHGWVSKKELANFWKRSHVWFYPCKFKETFCLTALEAACSRTLVINNNLAALKDTVADRGVVIEGDENQVITKEWSDSALEKIVYYLNNCNESNDLIEKNYKWAKKNTWKDRTNIFINNNKIMEEIYNFDKYMFLDDSQSHKIVNRYWSPNQDILGIIYNLCEREKYEKVLEIGPGNIPFKYANTFIDLHVSTDNYIKCDLDCEKISKDDFSFDFGYSRHILEDMQNPDYAFREFTRVCKSGYIETPSPLIEISKGVDAGDRKIRGYHHHRWIIWSELENNTIHFLPKYCLIQYLNLDSIFEKKLIDIANKYPKYWNNYYYFNSKYQPNIKVYKLYESEMNLIPDLIIKAIKDSINYTNNFNKILDDTSYFNSEKIIKELEDLDFGGMYNWVNDLPTGEKIIFEDVLSLLRYKKVKILEIGTFTGISFIAFLKYLPKSVGTVIDRWKNYQEKIIDRKVEILKDMEEKNIEQIFKNNIISAEVKDKTRILKGSSDKMLLQLINEGENFDFVYVDGNHNPFNTYLDCKLSWEMINNEGIMGIDDYFYNYDLIEIENQPKLGINKFLEEIEGEYKYLHKGYRIFIQKI